MKHGDLLSRGVPKLYEIELLKDNECVDSVNKSDKDAKLQEPNAPLAASSVMQNAGMPIPKLPCLSRRKAAALEQNRRTASS